MQEVLSGVSSIRATSICLLWLISSQVSRQPPKSRFIRLLPMWLHSAVRRQLLSSVVLIIAYVQAWQALKSPFTMMEMYRSSIPMHLLLALATAVSLIMVARLDLAITNSGYSRKERISLEKCSTHDK